MKCICFCAEVKSRSSTQWSSLLSFLWLLKVSRLFQDCTCCVAWREKRHLIQTLKITILLPLLEMLGILNTRHYFLQQSWRNCGQTHHLFLYNSINACNVILSMQTMQFYQCRQWNSISVTRSLLLLKLSQDL